MATVSLKNLAKNFGSIEVLRGIDLEIMSGEFVVLVGPSGCGKSTLLRIIAGLEESTAGDLLIDQKIVNHASPKERGVAMVFQNYALYPHMSVRENLEFSLKLSKVSAEERRRRVGEAAKVLGLETQLEKKPSQLSGGQKQRVAMGRAMVRHPKVFLFDEPLSNLDAQLRGRMRAEISQLHRKLKATSVYVTHDQVEAMTLADRVAVLNAGKLEQVGSPIELYERPRTKFVASFIGTPPMNFFSPGFCALSYPQGTKSIGVRPVNLSLEASRLGQSPLKIGEGKVSLVELLGATAVLHVSVRDENFLVELNSPPFPKIDTEVSLYCREVNLFYFDSNGNRIERNQLQ